MRRRYFRVHSFCGPQTLSFSHVKHVNNGREEELHFSMQKQRPQCYKSHLNEASALEYFAVVS
jgi:hypothetical protein